MSDPILVRNLRHVMRLRGPLASDPTARVLHSLLLSLFLWLGLGTAILRSFSSRPDLPSVLIIETALAGALVVLRRGLLRPAAWIYLAGMWIFTLNVMTYNRGIRGEGMMFLVALPISAAWLLGLGGALWTTAVCMASAVVFAILEMRGGRLPQLPPGHMPFGVLVLLLMAVLIGVIPLAHVLRTLRQAVLESRRAQEELTEYKTHLEHLVETRTTELLEARDVAVAANRAKSIFLANMSHELRTPLNAILGFSSLLRNTNLSDHQRRDLDIINRSGEHLLTLINDVLDVAKVEAGRTVITTAPCDVEALVFEVTEMMRVRAEEKQLTLLVEQTPSVPPYVKADIAKLRQVLINLLANAVKYTEEGSITLRLDAVCEASGESATVRFEVEDTGIGIAAEDQRRIFDAFEQVANAEAQKGTGLGLAITKQFVDLMGGKIELESAPGKGSRFRVEIPLEILNDVARKLPEVAREVVGLEAGQPEWRILIVEDHEESRAVLERMLHNAGLNVRTAGNGAVAIEVFEEWRPDFIFMDLRMSVMGGIEATKRIRSLPGGAEVKIAAMTASAFTSERERVLASGMQDFIRKPYRPPDVFDCLASHLGVRFQFVQEPTSPPTKLSNRTRTESLAGIPQELRKELADAVVSLNHERVAAVIVKVAEADTALAEVLRGMNDQASYTAILRLIEPSRRA